MSEDKDALIAHQENRIEYLKHQIDINWRQGMIWLEAKKRLQVKADKLAKALEFYAEEATQFIKVDRYDMRIKDNISELSKDAIYEAICSGYTETARKALEEYNGGK